VNARIAPISSAPTDLDDDPAACQASELGPSIPLIVEPSDSISSLTDSPISVRTTSAIDDFHKTRFRGKSNASEVIRPSPSGNSITGFGGLFRTVGRKSTDLNRKSLATLGDQSEAGLGIARDNVTAEGSRPATPQQRQPPGIDTSALPATPPNLVDAPATLVTPPTPPGNDRDPVLAAFPPFDLPVPKATPATAVSTGAQPARRRRTYSGGLSARSTQSAIRPLTPTVEEARTPGGTLTSPTNASGFFTTVFSAAQKAADQLSLSINTSLLQSPRSRPNTPQSVARSASVDPGASTGGQSDEQGSFQNRELAIETLGQGNLQLSHLGISDPRDASSMNSAADLNQRDGRVPDSIETGRKEEEKAAARAVSSAYEKPFSAPTSQISSRPLSIASNEQLTLSGDPHSLKADPNLENGDLKRAGSVRSRISQQRRRHRTSSATVATHNSVYVRDGANPNGNGQGHRLTGFAVASSKRNKDFHQLFRSVPEDDYLIEDYSAALQRDILLHGRLYVSEGHICFSSNILGWVTNLVISFDELTSVEKRNTAVIFPNAISISTLHARNTFASFVARDSTYELLIGIWKISHPNLKTRSMAYPLMTRVPVIRQSWQIRTVRKAGLTTTLKTRFTMRMKKQMTMQEASPTPQAQ